MTTALTIPSAITRIAGTAVLLGGDHRAPAQPGLQRERAADKQRADQPRRRQHRHHRHGHHGGFELDDLFEGPDDPRIESELAELREQASEMKARWQTEKEAIDAGTPAGPTNQGSERTSDRKKLTVVSRRPAISRMIDQDSDPRSSRGLTSSDPATWPKA
jgi:hypothetical protein